MPQPLPADVSTANQLMQQVSAAFSERSKREQAGIAQQFGAQIEQLPGAVKAAGGPDDTQLKSILRLLAAVYQADAVTRAALIKAYGGPVTNALKAVGLDPEQAHDSLRTIIGLSEGQWVPGPALSGVVNSQISPVHATVSANQPIARKKEGEDHG